VTVSLAMTFREKVTRTELKALTESNPRWRLFAGLAAAEPSTQHHHSGYDGASTAVVPSAKSQISYFVCLSIGRPRWDDLNRSTEKALRPPLSSIISRSSLSQASFGGLAKMHTRTTTVLIALDAAGVEFIGAALRLSVLESATSDLVHPAKLKFQEGRATVSSRSS
jgi:hypothetical protein